MKRVAQAVSQLKHLSKINRGAWGVLVLTTLSGVHPVHAQGRFTLTHDIDFSTSNDLDPQTWGRITGFNPKNTVFYTHGNQNLIFGDGVMRIQARKEWVENPNYQNPKTPVVMNIKAAPISSANVVSQEYFQYGRFEVVAKIPSLRGTHPAIWLQGKNQGQYGEIDIMEAIGAKNPEMNFATVHYGSSTSQLSKQVGKMRLSPGFHVYAAEWTPSNITIRYDGVNVLSMHPDVGNGKNHKPLHQPMQLRINLAAGGAWPGPADLEQLPANFDIKSIKIWRYNPD